MKAQALLVLLLVATFATLGYFLLRGGDDVAPANLPVGKVEAGTDSGAAGKPDLASAESTSASKTDDIGAAPELNRTAAPDVTPAGASAKGTLLRGRLVDGAGGARPGVVVSVDTWRDRFGIEEIRDEPGGLNESKEEVTTAADGTFQARVATKRAGTFSLPGSDFVFETRPRFTATEAELDLGDLVVIRASLLAGVVQDENGQPVAGVKVAAQLGAMGFSVRSNSTSAVDGTFSVGKLRPGSWTLATKSNMFLPTTKKIDVEAEQQVTGLVLVVKPGRTIAGRVIDDRGVGVAGMKVASQRKRMVGGVDIQRFTTDEAAVTDELGNFKLAGMEGKTATLRATGPGHTRVTLPNVETNTNNVQLRVERLATVSGIVVAPDGTPVVGTRVTAKSPSKNGGPRQLVEGLTDFDMPGSGPSTKTDELGKFVLEDVRPGMVTVKARGKTHLPVELDGVSVAPAQQVSGLRLMVDVGAIVRITILDGQGRVIPNAKVTIKKAAEPVTRGFRMRVRAEVDQGSGGMVLGNRALGTALSDENGVATIMGLPAGDVDAAVSHASYAPSADNRITMPASGAIERQISLQAPSFVDVVVTNTDGTVSVGTDVLLQEPSGGQATRGSLPGLEDQGLVAKKTTDADGKVRFGPVASGEYVAVLSRGPKSRGVGGMMITVGNENDQITSSAKQFSVGAGETASIKMQFPILARISGSVMGSEGPVVGCIVELSNVDDTTGSAGLSGHQERTDADGNFAFEGVENGKYELRYGKPDQVVKARLALSVPPNTREVHRDLVLRTGSVRVLVLSNEDAEPVERAEVKLIRAGAAGAPRQPQRRQQIFMISITSDGDGEETSSMTFGQERVVTDDDGIAVFEDVPIGQYTLKVESSKYAPGEKKEVSVVELQLTDCGTIELTRGGQIRGRVTKAGKGTMALVERRLAGTEAWDQGEMAMRGSYRLTGLAPGRYEVRARALGGNAGDPSEPETVEVVAGKTAVLNLKVE